MLQAARSGSARPGLLARFLHTTRRRGSPSTVLSPTRKVFYPCSPFAAHPQYAVLYYYGGWPGVVWAGAVRQVLMWHVTWLVNRQVWEDGRGNRVCCTIELGGRVSARRLAGQQASWRGRAVWAWDFVREAGQN